MKQIRTSRDKVYDAEYCGVGYLSMLKMQIYDTRPLSVIAPEFEDLDKVIFVKGDRERTFHNYKRLMRIERIDERAVVIILQQEGQTNASAV